MEISEYWRLSDELGIIDASLLVIGCDPELHRHIESDSNPDKPAGYEASKKAIIFALMRGKIKGNHVPEYLTDINGNPYEEIRETINIGMSSVDAESLREWLYSKGVRTGFFFPEKKDTPDIPDYLNSCHPRYSAKLAAAVSAWQAMDDGSILNGKSEKKALEKWLRENSARFGLVDDEGNPVNKAMEDCSTVANWNTTGGATKTPNA
jgi:hypothetical protein